LTQLNSVPLKGREEEDISSLQGGPRKTLQKVSAGTSIIGGKREREGSVRSADGTIAEESGKINLKGSVSRGQRGEKHEK